MAVVAWPPPTPPNTRANATVMLDNHPGDHDKIADALDTILSRMVTPTARVSRGGLYTYPTTAAAVPYDIVNFDATPALWVPAQNAFVVTRAGVWQLSAGAYISTSTVNTQLSLNYWVNGTSRAYLATAASVAAGGVFCNGTSTWRCVVGDKIQVGASCTPANSTTYTDANNNWACVSWLGP